MRVIVRCRPFVSNEKKMKCRSIVQINNKDQAITILNANSNQDNKTFTYDTVFGSESNNSQVYEESGFAMVESVIKGYNGKKPESDPSQPQYSAMARQAAARPTP